MFRLRVLGGKFVGFKFQVSGFRFQSSGSRLVGAWVVALYLIFSVSPSADSVRWGEEG